MNDVLRDLPKLEQAMREFPGIAGVRRRSADDLITHESWLVWLEGAWKADQAGTGSTLREAYLDARQRMEVLGRAA